MKKKMSYITTIAVVSFVANIAFASNHITIQNAGLTDSIESTVDTEDSQWSGSIQSQMLDVFRSILPQIGAKKIHKEEMQKKIDEMRERIRLSQSRQDVKAV